VLACPSASTSTSTRWAMVNLMYHACHGRGLNEVSVVPIRGIIKCREAMYIGLCKILIFAHRLFGPPLGPSDMFFCYYLNTPHISFHLRGWGMYV
jgi:hypothetical protein